MSLPETLPTAQVISAVFFAIINTGDYAYLSYTGDFEGEDPEDVRTDLANAIEETLATLGISSNAENCGEATDIVLRHIPGLNKFLEDTTE